jgi:hypothetical protein
MDLTRTERLILETAAGMFDIGLSPAEASLLSSLEISEQERAVSNGDRPQLGDLLVARGNLTAEELEKVLDKVFDELHAWSDSLAAPEPVLVPRPAPRTNTVQLTLLVQQLAGLLDMLVGDTPTAVRTFAMPGDGTVVGAPAVRPQVKRKTTAEINMGENLLGIDPGTIVMDDDADSDEGTKKVSKKADRDDDADADTRKTLQVERGSEGGSKTGQTLQVERSEELDPDGAGDTIQPERAEARPATHPTRDTGTLQLERPEPLAVPVVEVAPGDTAVGSHEDA